MWLLLGGLACLPPPSPAAGAPPAAPNALLWPVRGEAERASLAGFAEDARVRFRVAGETRTIPLDQLAWWGRFRDSADGGRVLLADGSQLVAEVLEVRDERVIVDSDVFGLVELPLTSVRGLLCRVPGEPLQRDRLCQQIAGGEGVEDRLLLPSAEQVRGVVEGVRVADGGPHAGLPVIVFATRGRTLELPLMDVVAVMFNPALVQVVQPQAAPVLLGLSDGSLLRAEQVEVAGQSVGLRLAAGIRLAAASADLAAAVRLIQPLGSVTYVSDLPPLGDESIPFLEIAWPPRRDRNVYGGHLRSGGGIYLKGLGMRSSSRSAYRLDAAYQRFQAQVALDERAGRGGSVVFKLFQYDASGRWQPAWESPVIRGGDPPAAVSVDIRGARALALIVEFAERGDVQDDANWLNPRLIP